MYLIGEASVGKGAELARIDILVGERGGFVGKAVVQGLTRGKAQHTALPSIIRPNLIAKPFTLMVPKVDTCDYNDIDKLFGPVQYAVAKAIADALEDGLFPRDAIDRLAIICGVYLDPKAEDTRKLFSYNYSAVKLALKRALDRYPTTTKMLSEKDRARHPLMRFRAHRLWMPPYLQVALDNPDIELVQKVVSRLPKSDRVILEVGTPLVKGCGLEAVRRLRLINESQFIIADLKTLDTGRVEVEEAMRAGADGVVVSGLASGAVLKDFILEAERVGIYPIVDMMAVPDPATLLRKLEMIPRVVILHRGIDQEATARTRWDLVRELKDNFRQLLIAVAGGITPEVIPLALESGVDIIIVGRYITQARDVRRAALEFIRELGPDMDLFRVHVE